MINQYRAHQSHILKYYSLLRVLILEWKVSIMRMDLFGIKPTESLNSRHVRETCYLAWVSSLPGLETSQGRFEEEGASTLQDQLLQVGSRTDHNALCFLLQCVFPYA